MRALRPKNPRSPDAPHAGRMVESAEAAVYALSDGGEVAGVLVSSEAA